ASMMEALKYFLYYALILIFYNESVECSQQHMFSPNIRYQASHGNASFNYSYINLKYLKAYKLNITPSASYNVNNKSQCAKECLKTKGDCKSTNLREMNIGFECEILGEDIYTSDYQLVEDSSITHFIIANKCLQNPCRRGSKCIPIYQNNSYYCAYSSCRIMKKIEPHLPTGYYNVLIAGKLRKVFCDMDEDGGGWMLVGNYSVPSTQVGPEINYGDLDSFEELSTGNFLLDSNIYLPVIDSSSPINEFRFKCYKPSTNRAVDITTDPSTHWGAYINRYILGRELRTSCQPPCGIRALTNDQSEMSTKANRIGHRNIVQLFYGAAFFEDGRRHVFLQDSLNYHDCDDTTVPSLTQNSPWHEGYWKFFVRC
uniref:Fibrinogen C-terminal domain-containing protein n=2 Tax=Clytia hemisphaerica TaxID=252671 RepID=A0A7M5UMU8_9CNID